MKYIALFLIISCGKIKVETNLPTSVKFGPDFEAASAFCDTKYGKDTQASEECFQDYRQYLKPKVTFDLTSIENFCRTNYSTSEDVRGCTDDLLDIIRGQSVSP